MRLETGLNRIETENWTHKKHISIIHCPNLSLRLSAPVVRTRRPSTQWSKTQEENKDYFNYVLFIILNILARVSLQPKFGYRSILPSGGRGFLSLWCLILDWEIEFEFSRKFVFAVKTITEVNTADSAVCMNLNIK